MCIFGTETLAQNHAWIMMATKIPLCLYYYLTQYISEIIKQFVGCLINKSSEIVIRNISVDKNSFYSYMKFDGPIFRSDSLSAIKKRVSRKLSKCKSISGMYMMPSTTRVGIVNHFRLYR